MPGAEATIGLIGAVGEDFAGGAEAGFLEDIEHEGAFEAVQDRARLDSVGDSLGDLGVLGGFVVERAVGFDVGDWAESIYLGGDGGGEFGLRDGERLAAEVFAIGIAGVGAGGDLVAAALLESDPHGIGVTGVAAASDVGGGNEVEELLLQVVVG